MTPSPNPAPEPAPEKSATPRTDAAWRYVTATTEDPIGIAQYMTNMCETLEADLAQARDTIKALREALEKILPLAITGASANAESHNFTGDFFSEDKVLIEAARKALASTQEDAP